MQIILYNNASAHNVVHKNKSQIRNMTGEIKENCMMEKVTINVTYFADYYKCNYAYIPEFHRFYYINLAVIEGNMVRLIMKSDALSSFYDGYKNSKIIARRSSSSVNPNIPDNASPFKPQPKIIHRKTQFGFTPSSSGYCYVLTLGGK